MTKDDLIDQISAETSVSKAEINRVLNAMAHVVADALAAGKPAQIPGLVKFERRTQAARTSRNPRTGDMMQVPEKLVVKAKVLAALTRAAVE